MSEREKMKAKGYTLMATPRSGKFPPLYCKRLQTLMELYPDEVFDYEKL